MDGASFLFGMHYPLPGVPQTVPRAEISAAVTVAEMVHEEAKVVYITDNLPLYDNFKEGEHKCIKSTNHDLYKLLFLHIKNKKLDFQIWWMPSHLDEEEGKDKERPEWVEDAHIQGNDQADRLAKIAARYVELDMNAVSPTLHYNKLVTRIQRRLIAILIALPHRKPLPRPQPRQAIKIDKPSVEQLVSNSEHYVYLTSSGKYQCLQCQSSLSPKDSNFTNWIRSSCTPIAPKANPLAPIGATIQIGNASSHPSHPIAVYKGLHICVKCGFLGNAKMHKLSEPCLGEKSSRYGIRNLKAVQRGDLPPQISSWPEDNSHFLMLRAYQQRELQEQQVLENIQSQIDVIHSQMLAGSSSSST